ncbi:LAGLIDADG endonuclease [Tuber brumale]|nr:LAGLIDADG endonuclease [Tuber brumale]
MKKTSKFLNSYFITGFSDAECCFFIQISKNKNCQIGYRIQLSFQIGLHSKDKALLEKIKGCLLNVGSNTKQGKDMIQYRVRSIEDLAVIIDHFDKFPLISQKQADYLLFKQRVRDVFTKSKTHKFLYQIQLNFRITQHSRDIVLINSLTKYLNCGMVYFNPKRSIVSFNVYKLEDILNIIIPFFEKYPLQGLKSSDFFDFCKIALLMKDKAHLTEEGLAQIREIKAGMNTGRKYNK